VLAAAAALQQHCSACEAHDALEAAPGGADVALAGQWGYGVSRLLCCCAAAVLHSACLLLLRRVL
jgi:hypothetical protein